MISIFLSVILYLVGFHFKSKGAIYVSHQNTYVLCVFIATVLLVCGLYGIVTALAGRMIFCQKLKRLARAKGYEYRKVRTPYLSFVKSCKGEDIVLTRREKVFRLKFFPGFLSRWFVHMESDKKAQYTKKIAFLGGFIRPRAPGKVYYGNREWLLWNKLFQFNRKIDLEFEKNNSENIVIIPTKCNELTFVEGNSRRIVGSGQAYGNKKLYCQKDFLNYFDRM